MRRLTGKIILSGTSLHGGKECRAILEPCDAPCVMMSVSNEECPLSMMRTDGTKRGSDYIFPNGERVRTCEHVFSALAGMGIYSGVRITVDGGEMPALDGCAETVCRHIMRSSCEDGEPLSYRELREPVIAESDDGMRFVCAFPSNATHATYTVEYDYIGVQTMDYVPGLMSYVEEIAPARTFAMKRDIEYLRSHGMALGGSLRNAIVVDRVIEAEGGLRWENEFVRHKMLDLVGDMYSIGFPVKARIIAMRGGHELHLRLAEKMKGAID